MSTTTAPITDPMARLEGAYERLATKADLAQLELRLTQQMAQMETRLTWRMIGAAGVIIAAVGLIVRFL